MSIPNNKKSRILVISITIIILVTAFTAGCYLREETVDIDVEEETAEITIEHLSIPDDSDDVEGDILQINSTAVTQVNDFGSIKSNINVIDIVHLNHEQHIRANLSVIGDFEELELETLRFTVAETYENKNTPNSVNFLRPNTSIDNGGVWSSNENIESKRLSDPDEPAYVGFDLQSKGFEGESEIKWAIPDENVGEDFTLKLQAVVDGQISEKIVSTVQIHIVEEREEETYTGFEIFDETGEGYDYPTDLRVGETGKVTVVVNNQEWTLEEYSLVIGLGESYEDMEIIEEITGDFNFTFPSNNTAVETDIELKHDEELNQKVKFSIEEPGDNYKLNFFLFRDEEIYRNLYLYVDVSEEQP